MDTDDSGMLRKCWDIQANCCMRTRSETNQKGSLRIKTNATCSSSVPLPYTKPSHNFCTFVANDHERAIHRILGSIFRITDDVHIFPFNVVPGPGVLTIIRKHPDIRSCKHCSPEQPAILRHCWGFRIQGPLTLQRCFSPCAPTLGLRLFRIGFAP